MRILFHHRIRSKDGQYVHLEEMVRALRALGNEVEVVGPAATERKAFGCEGGAVDLLKRAMPAAGYECLEIGYGAGPAFLRLHGAWRRLRPDVLYERYTLNHPAGLMLKRIADLPMILEVNSPLVKERSEHRDAAASRGLTLLGAARALERAVWRGADVVLPVTRPMAAFVAAAGVSAERIHVVPNGVGPEFLTGKADASATRRRLGLEGATVLGFTGFVREWHGVEAAVDAVADAPRGLGMHLLVVGDGPALPSLRRRAEERGVSDRMRFVGVVERREVSSYVAAFDVALQPRAVPWASPLKIFEYMAMGRAVVAPDQANIREALDAGCALLFPPDDMAACRASALRLAANPALRMRLGEAGRARLLERGFTWESNARRVTALAHAVLAAHEAARGETRGRRSEAAGLKRP